MAHLLDREVAGHVVLQTPSQAGSDDRISLSFSVVDIAGLANDANVAKKTQRRRSLRKSHSPDSYTTSTSYPAELWSVQGGRHLSSFGSSFGTLKPLVENATLPADPLETDPAIWFEESVRTFHLAAGGAQYSMCVDANGWLEHLYYGPFIGKGHDLTYLSESDPALVFEPAPAGAQYKTGELLRLVCEQKLDVQQLWSMSANMKGEKGHDWHMTRVENLTWRLRHYWSSGQRARLKGTPQEGETYDDAEQVLKILEKALLPFNSAEETKKQGDKTTVEGRQGEKSTKLLEVSELGTGDYRLASLEVCFQKDGSRLSPLVYRNHRIIDGIVPSSSGCPLLGMRTCIGQKAKTLIVDMVDPYSELKVELLYTLFPGFPVVSRRSIVHNSCSIGWGKVNVLKAMSATCDFLTDDWHLTSLHGGWAAERQITTRRLKEGTLQLGSRRGVSSHQTNPFCVLSAGAPAEEHGRCFGMCLLYSGNWMMEIEQSETGCIRATAGINDAHFSWGLNPGEFFDTPECIIAFSNEGMGKLTSTYQNVINHHLLAERWSSYICPVLINTWEAMYFEVSHEKVLELAEPAKKIGVEMIVLDDGWFSGRNSDHSSLGDWTEDLQKFPNGLRGLATDLNSMGLSFGIWVEPEMVNTNSNLYRNHPEWVLYHPKRVRSEGRNQLVLDLTRKEVQDYIIDSVGNVLRNANIKYVKWDMNRALTDAYSAGLPTEQQGEVYHRYVLGLYRIFHSLTECFPHVLFESCSSGGGRFDAALLAWCPQCWTSDNTDALCRVTTQLGTSMWAPSKCMGAHITACPNHQTHRTVVMKTRFIVALWGTFGLELDLRKMSEQELADLQGLIQLRQLLAPLIFTGDFHRLPGFGYPTAASQASAGFNDGSRSGNADAACYAWMFVSSDRNWALACAVVIHQDRVGRFPSRLKMRGLRNEAVYQIDEHVPTVKEQGVFNGVYEPGGPQRKHKRRLVLSGSVLMNLGVPVHFEFGGDSILLELREVGAGSPQEGSLNMFDFAESRMRSLSYNPEKR